MQNIRSHTRLGNELLIALFILFVGHLNLADYRLAFYASVAAQRRYGLTVEPASCATSVRQGGSCLFKCDVRHPAIFTMTWIKVAPPGITSVPVQRERCGDVPEFPSDYVTTCVGQYYTLNITRVTYGRDNYPWVCSNIFNSMRSTHITLNIKVFPKGIMRVVPPDVREGQTAGVNCTTTPYTPAVSDGYILVGGVKHGATTTTTRQADGLYVTVVTSTFTFRSTLGLACVVVYEKQTLELVKLPITTFSSSGEMGTPKRLLAVILIYWYNIYAL